MSFTHHKRFEIDVSVPTPQVQFCFFSDDCGLEVKVEFAIANHPSGDRVQIVLEKMNNFEELDFQIEAYVENIHGMKEYYFRMNSPLDGSTKFCIFNVSAEEFAERVDDLYPHGFLNFNVIIIHEHPNTDMGGVAEVEKEFVKELSEHPFIDCPGYDLLNLLISGKMADVFIECGDRTFPAHMAILSARLPMLSAKHLNDKNAVADIISAGFKFIIHIPDIEPPEMEKLLIYAYTGTLLDIPLDNAAKLLLVAVRYEVHKLKEECSKRISFQLNDRDICDVLLIAQACKNDYLMKAAIEYLRNRKNFLISSKWHLFVKKNRTFALWLVRQINKIPSKL